MKKFLPIFFALIITAVSIDAQTGNISGTVTQGSGIPAQFVNVAIEGTTLGDVTNKNGEFEIKRVKPGTYNVIASMIGYASVEKHVKVEANKTVVLNFVISESSLELQTVEIIGRKEVSYKTEISFAATKTATRLKDLPQSVSYVTKEVFADKQAYRVNDIVENISGINQFSYYNDFTIRGFRSQQELINGMRVIGLFGPQTILANLERVEVIKGPASAVFGNASPGGTMNRVTKKPLDIERKAVSYTTGSFNTTRAAADFTGPLTEGKTLLYRFNLAYENSGSFRDLQEFKSFMIAPSISFLPTEDTQLNFDLVITQFDGKLDRGQPIFGASAGTDLNSTPISFAIGAANDYHKTNVAYGSISLIHKLNDWLSLNASYMRYGYEEDLFEHRTSNRFAVDSAGNEIPTLMGMRISAREQNQVTDNLSSFFVYETNTGEINHRVLAGYDYIQSETPRGSAGIFTSSSAIYRTKDGGLAQYDPNNKDNYFFDANGNPEPNIPHFNLENPNYLLGYPSDYILGRYEISPSKYYTHGIYLQDQIKWDRIQLLLGLRQEFYTDLINYDTPNEETIEQDKLLPRFGIVYQLNEQINLYGTYTESFQPQNPSDLETTLGGPFDPLTGQMFEVGAKGTFFSELLAVNAALYIIENKNILITDVNTGLLTQRGAEESQGIEIDVNGRITPNFSITTNYAYNEAKITESDNKALEGRIKENAPKHSGGFFANYSFDNKLLKGVNLNLGASFVSERNTFEETLTLPSYIVWDAGISYHVNKVKAAFTLNNVLDETHWVGGYSYVRLFPGAPRNFLITLGYTF